MNSMGGVIKGKDGVQSMMQERSTSQTRDNKLWKRTGLRRVDNIDCISFHERYFCLHRWNKLLGLNNPGY